MPLIFSPALVVTPVDGSDEHYPLIGWRNQVSRSGLSADSEASGYPVTNLANPATTNRWLSASTSEQLVTVSGLDGVIDYVGIARHNFGSAEVIVSVEAITAEPGAGWEEVAATVPANDEPLLFRLVPGYYTDVRLRLTPGGAIEPWASVLYVGGITAVRPGLRPGFSPPQDARDVDVSQGISISGEYLGAIVDGASMRETYEFELIDPDYYDAHLRDFVAMAREGGPFFFAWDPATHPQDASYCWLPRGVRPTISRSTGEVQLTLETAGIAL